MRSSFRVSSVFSIERLAKGFFFHFFFLACALFSFSKLEKLEASTQTKNLQESYMKGLWSRIQPTSLRDMLCFFHLYPDVAQKNELDLRLGKALSLSGDFLDTKKIIKTLLSCLIEPPTLDGQETLLWSEETLKEIEALSATRLKPRCGYIQANSLDDLLKVDPSKWDISQVAWLCSCYPSTKQAEAAAMRQYYARIDLLALSALFAIEKESVKPENLSLIQIEKINQIVFQEQGFEFPPLLDHQSRIDLYTSVPSMLSSKKGVCLGVSVLYLAIAQRLGLDLELVTPPGHIYLSFSLANGEQRNIETTANGMNVPEEFYRPLQSSRLIKRELKELPGLILMNTASVFLRDEKFAEASLIYDQALKFLNPNTSFFIQELAMLCHWLGNRPGANSFAQKLWQQYQKSPKESLISWDPLLLEEINKGLIGREVVRLIFASEGSDDPTEALRVFNKLEKFSKDYPRSKWIKSQMALTAWGLNQKARAFFLWPYEASLASSFLWIGSQISMEVGQFDVTLTCMNQLKEQLAACDLMPLTPYTSALVALRQQTILSEN